MISFQDEEPLEPLGTDVGLDSGGIPSLAREPDRILIQIGGKNLDLWAALPLVECLKEQHRQAISFLACRAPDRPGPDGLGGLLFLQDLRNNLCCQLLPCLAVTKEARHPDQDVVK